MRALTAALMALLLAVCLAGQARAQEAISLANEAVTGTTLNKLAKLAGAPSTAIISAITDTDNAVGIVLAGAGTSGNAIVAILGTPSCVFDATAVTAGDYVTISSTTAGACHDAGATRPTATQVIGRAMASGAGGSTIAVEIDKGFANAAGSGSFANPTATAGAAAINGVASTAMRSDAAPAIAVMNATTAGLVPTPPNDATKFLNGQGAFTVPAGGGITCDAGFSASFGQCKWTQTFSANSSLDFTGLLRSTYGFTCDGIIMAAGGNLGLRLGHSGTYSADAKYRVAGQQIASDGTSNAGYFGETFTGWLLNNATATSGSVAMNVEGTVHNLLSTSVNKIANFKGSGPTSTHLIEQSSAGDYTGTDNLTAANNLRFIDIQGTPANIASGTCTVTQLNP